MRSRRALFLSGLLGLTVVTGCTTTSQGSPRPDDTGTTQGSSGTTPPTSDGDELPFAGAPEVPDPLETTRFEQDPCLSLTSEQAEYLSLPAAGQDMENVALGKGCEWVNAETRGTVHIVFLVEDPRGLSPEYEAEENGEWTYFEELPDIEGFPAVARSGTDDRDLGGCTVVVGVADDMAFESIVRLSQVNVGKTDPCDAAADVAGLAIQTMKQGA